MRCLAVTWLARTRTEWAMTASEWINAWDGKWAHGNHSEVRMRWDRPLVLGSGAGGEKKIDQREGRGSWVVVVGCGLWAWVRACLNGAEAPDAQIQSYRGRERRSGRLSTRTMMKFDPAVDWERLMLVKGRK